ncbi:MAG: diguanylate cyclase [Sphingomonadaceae bacterium]|nr:diguanylate cyclase [Sphingomonadaceae bacterium]
MSRNSIITRNPARKLLGWLGLLPTGSTGGNVAPAPQRRWREDSLRGPEELREQSRDESREETLAIADLMGRLETQLETFSSNAREAQSATSQYSGSLEQHVADLTLSQDTTGQIISHLADLTKVMLARTREIETDMRRNEQEASMLRLSLADAKRDAETDHLTGLPNRRAFEILLDAQFEEAQGAGDALSVAFCDIDFFKRINDTHGHDAGDRVIRAIGAYFSGISDDNCHIARHGGEEFVVLFRNIDITEARSRLDEARETMAARNMRNRENDEPIGPVTFSGGLADIFSHEDARAALRAADQALYKAKQSGRNRICVAGEPDPEPVSGEEDIAA